MSKRRSFYIGQALNALLADRTEEGKEGRLGSASGTLNAIADRYIYVLQKATPRLTRDEWCALWDALKGVWSQEPASLAVRGIVMEVSEAVREHHLGEAWAVDGSALVAKVEAMSVCEHLAIVDAAERAWLADPDGTGDRRAMVEQIVGAGAVEGK